MIVLKKVGRNDPTLKCSHDVLVILKLAAARRHQAQLGMSAKRL
jgi:hypothetical protein